MLNNINNKDGKIIDIFFSRFSALMYGRLVNREDSGAGRHCVINGEHIATKGGGVRLAAQQSSRHRVSRAIHNTRCAKRIGI